MRRGSVVTVADRAGDFTSKPRPAVVVQSEFFAGTGSVTICPITSVEADAPLIRLQLEPSSSLPLDHVSWIEVDKITTVRGHRIGSVIGMIGTTDLIRLNGALVVFLGLG